MPRMEWEDSFSVGVPEIDEQHQRWIDLINKLHDSIMDRKTTPDMTGKVLSEMVDYANFHFAFEEDYLQRTGYPDLKKHRYLHEYFRKDVVGKLGQERAGQLVMNREVMKMLMDWLRNHILHEDMKYKPAV